MADVVGIGISFKRVNKINKNRANPCIDGHDLTSEKYYRITVAIPFNDSFIQQLNERFLKHKNIFKGWLIYYL